MDRPKMKLLAVFTHFLRLSPHLYIRRFDREGHSHFFTLDARYAHIVESTDGLGGWACKGWDMTQGLYYQEAAVTLSVLV